ncbi:MAG: hypothetical protein F4X64_18585 [Chloroflexi bacterium]|nr:hypothetical protein [Chloroflexota bacterium]
MTALRKWHRENANVQVLPSGQSDLIADLMSDAERYHVDPACQHFALSLISEHDVDGCIAVDAIIGIVNILDGGDKLRQCAFGLLSQKSTPLLIDSTAILT